MKKMKKIKKIKRALWTNALYIDESLVTNKIKGGFTHRCVNYYGGGEDNIGEEYSPDADDLLIEGFKYYPAKHKYGFFTGNRNKLNKYFHNFDIDDQRSKTPMSNRTIKLLDINDSFSLKSSQVSMINSWMKKKNGIIKAPARSGKCIIGSSLILTDNGIMPIENICSNCLGEDYAVLNSINIVNYRNKIESSSVSYRGFNSKTIQITSKMGYNVEGTKVHPILTLNESNSSLEWKNLSDIKLGDRIAVNYGKNIWSRTRVYVGNKIVNKDCAAILGYLTNTCTIYSNLLLFSGSKEIIKDFSKSFEKVFPNVLYTVEENNGKLTFGTYSSDAISFLGNCGLAIGKNSHIPWCILQSPKKIITRFLRSLFKCMVEDNYLYCAHTSERLINEIQIVLANYGILSSKLQYSHEGCIEDKSKLRISWKFIKKFKNNFGFKKTSIEYEKDSYFNKCNSHKYTYWDKVISICNVDKKSKVYDLMVLNTHSFVANSLVCHNTVIMGYIVAKLKLKTLILANQNELLVQWKKEFSKVTNVDTFATKDKPVIGILKRWKDIDKYDIVLSTWQKWNRNRKKLRKYRDAFGLIFVDEIHRCNANCPKEVVANFSARYRGGVTATVERKDGKEVYMNYIIGPVTAEGTPEQMKCKVCFVKTGLPWGRFSKWVYLINGLCRNEKRNNIIVSLAVKLAKSGKHIVIGSDRTEHILKLTADINKMGVRAEAFFSKSDRSEILKRASSGKTKVIVANRSMLTGINVPIWDTYLNILPINNEPTYYQQFSRIRTVIPEKKEALIYDLVDSTGLSMGLANKRKKQYEKEKFIYIPGINGNLERLNKSYEEQKSEYSTFAKVKSNRANVKSFFPKRSDSVSLAAIFKK